MAVISLFFCIYQYMCFVAASWQTLKLFLCATEDGDVAAYNVSEGT